MYYDTFKMIDGDIYIDRKRGDLVLVSGGEELRQNIENRLSINKDEWFLNTELGLSYKDIRGKGVSDEEIGFAIRECTAQDDRIKATDIGEVERYNNRFARINIVLHDEFGNVEELKEVELG